MEGKRKQIEIDGVMVDAPAEMPDEEVHERHRELQEAIEEMRAETETLDQGRISRLIAEDLANADPPWDPQSIAFFQATADTVEIAALYRATGEPLTQQERLKILQQKHDERRAQ